MAELTLILTVCGMILTVIVGWRLLAKAGYPGLFTLIFFIPYLGVLFLVYLIMAKWPIEEELELYRQKYGPLTPRTPTPEVDTTCLSCGATIASGYTVCSECGWTYSNTVSDQR